MGIDLMNSIELAQKLARTPRILIIDDDKLIRFVFSAIQHRYYLDVETIGTPHEAIQRLTQSRYDAVFLDMKFENGSGIDGMEVLRQMNIMNLDTRVIIMSGSVNLHSLMSEANRLGVLSFIIKPVSFTHEYVIEILRKIGIKLVQRPPDDLGPQPEIPQK